MQDFIQRDEFINKFASSFQITKVKIENIINKAKKDILQFKKDNLLENLDFVSLCSIKA